MLLLLSSACSSLSSTQPTPVTACPARPFFEGEDDLLLPYFYLGFLFLGSSRSTCRKKFSSLRWNGRYGSGRIYKLQAATASKNSSKSRSTSSPVIHIVSSLCAFACV
mmetsp:Transcript_13478/g.35412  ORF Transcript_13478/g.35412 Transcript_13478/m.35412 type:complete len:108 (-) Transcript_13478:50-373(-)